MPLTKLNVLIVHAHHEPQSFCSALFRHSAETLTDAGHHVVTSDLYAQGFDPVSDRRNFTSTFDANYFKQGKEERHATAVGGFAPDLEREIRKLESCDLLVFSYPLWWFAMPAILKGWVDRTFAYARIFGDTKMYENGLGQGRKRAMTVMKQKRLRPLPRNVEAEIPIAGGRSAAGNLAHCRREGIGNVQLEGMASRSLLDGEASVVCTRAEACHAWTDFRDDRHRRPHAKASAEADHHVSVGAPAIDVEDCTSAWCTHVGSAYTAARSPNLRDTMTPNAGES
jgi:putative NADPH-quinone reductase